jgi:hypothetical protein
VTGKNLYDINRPETHDINRLTGKE